jgi:hypothetical protein
MKTAPLNQGKALLSIEVPSEGKVNVDNQDNH